MRRDILEEVETGGIRIADRDYLPRAFNAEFNARLRIWNADAVHVCQRNAHEHEVGDRI